MFRRVLYVIEDTEAMHPRYYISDEPPEPDSTQELVGRVVALKKEVADILLRMEVR